MSLPARTVIANSDGHRRGSPPAWRVALGLVFVAGLVLRLWTAFCPLEGRPFSGLPDDSFYYFSIARNLAEGHVASIDGVSPTNGFHPLWMLVLFVIFRAGNWGSGAITPLHVAFTIGALLDVASAYLVLRLLLGLRIHRNLSLLITSAFLLNPYAVELSTWGLETPLALFFALVFAKVVRGPRRASPVVFGVAGGLMALSRTDHAVVFAVASLLHLRRMPAPERGRFLGRATAAFAVSVLPWALYSWRTTGTLVQSSSLALAIVNERMPAAWGLDHEGIALRGERLVGSLLDALHLTATFSGMGGAITVLLTAACVTIRVTSSRSRRARLVARLRLLAPWGGGLVVLFFLHCFVRKVFREWYTAPFVVLGLVTVAICVDSLRGIPLRVRRLGFSALAVVLLGCLAMAWRGEKVFTVADFNGWNGQAGRHEGHTDCGAASYFLEARITNLDGVVNEAALTALRAGRLVDYIAQGGFDRVVITPQLRSWVFLGARYRERLRGISGDDYGAQIVTAGEKDAVLGLGESGTAVGSSAGRELLGDGWDWPMTSTRLVASVGRSSELVFVPEGAILENRMLEMELMADAEVRDVQPVSVSLNGKSIGRITVGSASRWYSVEATSLLPGRNRLRLDYGDARPVRRRSSYEWWSGWNWIYGGAVRAVRLGSLRLALNAAALPPEGPSLEDPKSDALFRSGFMAVEHAAAPASVWAVEGAAQIEFASSLDPSGRMLVLVMGPPPPQGKDGGQHVELSLNGKELPGFDLDPGTVSRTEVPVPEGLLLRTGNRLAFRFRRLSPKEGANISRAAYFREVRLE